MHVVYLVAIVAVLASDFGLNFQAEDICDKWAEELEAVVKRFKAKAGEYILPPCQVRIQAKYICRYSEETFEKEKIVFIKKLLRLGPIYEIIKRSLR